MQHQGDLRSLAVDPWLWSGRGQLSPCLQTDQKIWHGLDSPGMGVSKKKETLVKNLRYFTFTGMRAFGAVAGLEGGRAEGGLEVALGGPGLDNPEGPGRLSEGGKLGSRGDGGVAPMVRLTEVR